MTPKERAIELLCQGVSTTMVADAVGVDPSYISQLRSDPAVAVKISEALSQQTLEDVKHDSLIDKCEELALQRIEKTIGYANFGQTLAAFKILNSATRRQQKGGPSGGNITNVTVNLTLPSRAIPAYTTNEKNEIIEVEGRTMIAATAKSLDEVLAARATENSKNIPQITDVEKAANILDILGAKQRTPLAPRRLPAGLSVDCL